MIQPFSCGTQYLDWERRNCDNCCKQGSYTDATQHDWVWHCELQEALSVACIGSGEITPEIAQRIGYEPFAYGWRCTELEPVRRESEYLESLKPRPVRLAPLWMRVRRSLCAAWEFWIKPWDRADYDYYEGLRSPFLAWSVAWGIHRDDKVRI